MAEIPLLALWLLLLAGVVEAAEVTETVRTADQAAVCTAEHMAQELLGKDFVEVAPSLMLAVAVAALEP